MTMLVIILVILVIYLFIALENLQNKMQDFNVSLGKFLSSSLIAPLDYIKDRETARSLQKKFLSDLFEHVDRTSDNIKEYEKRVDALFVRFELSVKFDDAYEINRELMEILLDHIEVEHDSLIEKSDKLWNKPLERRKTNFK